MYGAKQYGLKSPAMSSSKGRVKSLTSPAYAMAEWTHRRQGTPSIDFINGKIADGEWSWRGICRDEGRKATSLSVLEALAALM